MSKTLTFELLDEVYNVLQQKAARTGRPFEDVALEFLLKHHLKSALLAMKKVASTT